MGLIPKIGEFLGIKKFGQGLATSARVLTGEVGKDIKRQEQNTEQVSKIMYAYRQEKDPAKKRNLLELADSMGKLGTEMGAAKIDPGLNLNKREIIGSAANVGLNVLMPGAFKGSKAAIVGKNALLGAGFGAGSGLEKGRSASGVIGSTVGGALIGGAIGGLGLLAKGTKEFLTKTTPKWLMDNAIKPSLNELKKNIKYGTKTLGQELLDEGVKGSPQKLLDIANSKTGQLESQLQEILNAPFLSKVKITRNQINPYLESLLKQKAGTPGLASDVQKINSVIKSIPKSMNLLEANQMKRRIYTELRDVAYKLDPKLGARSSALKQIARGLKTEIEKAVGETTVQDINRQLSIYGRLEDSIVSQLARNLRNNGVSLTDAILIAGGELKPSGFLASIVRKTIGSAQVKTGTAQILSKGKEIGEGVVGKTAKELIRRGSFNAP